MDFPDPQDLLEREESVVWVDPQAALALKENEDPPEAVVFPALMDLPDLRVRVVTLAHKEILE